MKVRRDSTATNLYPQSVDFLDDDSSTTDFSKLPLAKLEWEGAPDSELDHSRLWQGATPSPTTSNDIRSTPKKSGSIYWESDTASIVASPSSTWTCPQPYDSMSMATTSSSPKPFVAACDSADWGMDPVGFWSESRSPYLTKNQIEKRVIQLMIGKETNGYINYRRTVSKRNRRKWHPRTPDPLEEISKRRFNGKVSKWRRKLHGWDFLRYTPSISPKNESSLSAEASRVKAKSSENVLNEKNRETFMMDWKAESSLEENYRGAE